jgi:hypothetical protein
VKKLNLAFILLALLLVGCGDQRGNSEKEAISAPSKPAAVEEQMRSSAPANSAPARRTTPAPQQPKAPAKKNLGTQLALQQADAASNEPVRTERKIVRNGELALESDDPEETQRKISSIAEAKGGFVVESNQSSSDSRAGRRDIVSMTIRVPSEKFAETLDEVRKTAGRVVSESAKADDVTEEFIDTESDLKAKRALEAQFLEIMKRANTVEEAMGVQRELGNIRAEIEKLEGRKRFLENQASLSTIKIRIQTAAVFAGSATGFGAKLRESFTSGLDFAIEFVLFFVRAFVALLPLFVVVGTPIFLLVRYLRRKNARKDAETAAEIRRESADE